MATLLVGADLCPIGGNRPYFQAGDAHSLFHDLLPEFEAADLVLANLECPLIEKTSPIRKTGPVFGDMELEQHVGYNVVCDGFIGNVALKISEGVADTIKKLLIKEISGSFLGRLAYPLIATPLLNLKKKIDYAEFGGAPLLGVNGITMICHGRSSAKAIKNAIRRAKGLAEHRVDELIRRDIEESLSQTKPTEDASA